jgi:glycogen synthase
LKPVHDTRLYEKIGQTLAAHFSDSQIYILAHQTPSPITPIHQNIQFIPLFHFKRLHFKRIFANWKLWKQLVRLKPDLVIIATFELLPAAIFYKISFGKKKKKIIYDVQENYAKNILHTQVFPFYIKYFLAFAVSAIERITQPWIDFYLLAENCYQQELKFTQSKSEVIANKFIQPQQAVLSSIPTIPSPYQLIYTGTISEDYGILRAIHFTQKLHTIEPRISLKIIGFAPKLQDLEKVKKEIKDLDFITLIGGESLVSHSEILQEIHPSSVVLMPYQVNKSVENRIPTKFYECLALQKPMLIQHNDFWKQYLENFDFQTALFIDFDDLANVKNIWEQIQRTPFYATLRPMQGIYWEEEAQKLIKAVVSTR